MPLGVSPQGVFVKPYPNDRMAKPTGNPVGVKPSVEGPAFPNPMPAVRPINPARQSILAGLKPFGGGQVGMNPGIIPQIPFNPGVSYGDKPASNPVVMPPNPNLVSMPVPNMQFQPMQEASINDTAATRPPDKFGAGGNFSAMLQQLLSNPQILQMLFAGGRF